MFCVNLLVLQNIVNFKSRKIVVENFYATFIFLDVNYLLSQFIVWNFNEAFTYLSRWDTYYPRFLLETVMKLSLFSLGELHVHEVLPPSASTDPKQPNHDDAQVLEEPKYFLMK